MKLTIVAASGRTGRQVLDRAIVAGHEVTAVVRDPAALADPDRPAPARIVTADLATPDAHALASAVAGADAVLSGLGPRRSAEFGIASLGTGAIVRAMRETGTRRIVVVSVAGVGVIPTPHRPHPPKRDPGVGWFTRTVLSPIARARLGRHYTDVALMEEILRESGLDWTSVRLPLLTDKPATGRYRTAFERSVRGGSRLARGDAAEFMLTALDRPDTIGHAVAIAY